MSNKFSSPTNQYHLLRHYKNVSDKYTNLLIGKPCFYYDYTVQDFKNSTISTQDIHHALQTIGTKFAQDIPGIETPKKLLEIIESHFKNLQENQQITWQQEQDYQCTSFIFEYSHPVGNINCLAIESLTMQQKARIKQVTRSQCKGESTVLVNTIQDIPTKTTNKICVQITMSNESPFLFISAYPCCDLPSGLSLSELVFVI